MYNKTIYSIFLGLSALLASEALTGVGCGYVSQLQYKLFGTKTTYDNARRYLINDLPDDFDGDSIEKEHKDLLANSCKPVMFYFVGRHAARFPENGDIDKYNNKMDELLHVLRQDSSLKDSEKLRPFLEWRTRMEPGQNYLLTDLGAKEERDIARRFKHIYPEFFDAEKSEIKFGDTTKMRTAQTGVEFLKEIRGLSIAGCDESSLPTNDVDNSEYSVDKILENKCYKTLLDKYSMPFLEFYAECGKIRGKKHVKSHLVKRLKDPSLVREIADRVAKKLGLPEGEESPITAEILDVIFEECRYETANDKESIWCSLFDRKDVEFVEYIKDVDVYINNAYGPVAQNKQACPVINDVIKSINGAIDVSASSDAKLKSYFYFSHAAAMKKILSAFGLFKDDDSYTEQRIEELVEKKKIDDDREWRTSLLVPFSANMAFISYRCEKPGQEVEHKILTTVNELPVKLHNCGGTHCLSNKFFEQYEDMQHCDLREICKI